MSIARDLYSYRKLTWRLKPIIKRRNVCPVRLVKARLCSKPKPNWRKNRKTWETLTAQQKSTEWEIDDLTTKIKDTEKKLYGGKIFNSKELSSLQQETDDLKKRRSVLEDKSLGLMDQLELTAKAITASKEELSKLEIQWQAQQKQLMVELLQLKASQTVLESNRQQITALIDADTLFHLSGTQKKERIGGRESGAGNLPGMPDYLTEYRPAAGQGRRYSALQQLRPDYLSRLKNYEINH